MSRPVDTTQQQLLDADSIETQSTIELRLLSGEILRYSTREVPVGANTFTEDLRQVGEITQSAFSNVDRAQASIQNADKIIGLKILNDEIDKAVGIVGRFMRDEMDETKTAWVELFRGETKATGITPTSATIEIVDELVAAGYCVADESYAPDCPLVYAEMPRCGADPALPPCSHNLATCRVLHHFAGMETKIERVVVAPGDDGGGGGGIGGGGDDGGGYKDCFIGGTLIDTPNGRKKIERITAGDNVYSFNPITLEIQIDCVVQTFSNITDGYFEITISGDNRVSVTKKHKFLTEKNIFTVADDLCVGQSIFARVGNGLIKIEIESKRWVSAPETIYNFRVRKNPTYFANGLAVHNRKQDPDYTPFA